MNLGGIQYLGQRALHASLLIAMALSVWLAATTAGAQSTCNGLAATIVGAAPGLINGTAGDDVILGTTGVDQIFGLGGDDVICGDMGADAIDGGEGSDTFVWNPGDSSDLVEGRAGVDTLQFHGSNANENIDLSANGARLRFFRDVASVTMDVDGTEQISYGAVGGADTITVNSLAGTVATTVTLNLASTLGGSTGDAQADSITVNGTATPDQVALSGDTAGISLTGLSAAVKINTADGALDSLRVNLLGGDDALATQPSQRKLFLSLIMAGGNNLARADAPARLSAQAQPTAILTDALPAGLIGLTLNGGPGNDTLSGSQGNDTFVWNPGDGSDVVEGQAGVDTLQFNGSNVSENISLSANGSRLGLLRDVANIAMDIHNTEQVELHALGGADTITVGDLSSTAVTTLTLDLAGIPGSGAGDTQPDKLTLSGTPGDDTIAISGGLGSLAVLGLPTKFSVAAAESTDSLAVNTLGGNDSVSAQTLPAGVAGVAIDGGAGNDAITGSQGNDLLFGGDGGDVVAGNRGDDLAFLGSGDDMFGWNPGDANDTVEGQAGIDTLVFNGANVSENIDLSANGARLRFLRNVANVTMDLNDTEHVVFNALGGADTITVNSLAGTSAQQVNLNLANSLGTGDGQADTVIVNGTGANDNITIGGSAGSLTVEGLSAVINASSAESALDGLRVFALAGADLVSAQTLPAGVANLALDGGTESDSLVGSTGDDLLTGGLGADQFSGGPGTDTVTDFNAAEGDTQDGTIP